MIIRIRLPSCPLFEGIAPEALLEELARLQAAERKYKAGETLLAAGSPTSRMGLVLEGELHAILPTAGTALLQSRLLRGVLLDRCWRGGRAGKPRDRNCPYPLPRAVDPDEEPPDRWRNAFFRTASEQSVPSAKQRLFLIQRRLICLTQPTLRERLLYYLRTECYTQGSRTRSFAL